MADGYPEREVEGGSSTIAFVLVFALGLLFGWGIGGERKEKSTAQWAVQTVERCENTFRADGYSSVASCLQSAMDAAEAEVLDEARAQARDP